MRLLNDFRHLHRGLFLLIAATSIIRPAPVMAQSFCGPVTLMNFNGTNGQYPVAGVTFDSQGNMFGTTAQGGASFNPLGSSVISDGLGTIWEYSSTAGFTSLFSFSGATSPSNNGDHPLTPLLIDSQGNLYGTTYLGGNDFQPDLLDEFGWGTLFKFSPAGQLTTLYEFSGPDGINPIGMIRDSQGNLVGVTSQGGANWNPGLGDFGLGTLFQLPQNGLFTNPVLFTEQNGGGTITGGLVSDGLGNYYGTTYQGGTSGKGSIFKYSLAGGVTTLVNFNGLNGMLPSATPVLDGQGNLYGTALQGGAFSGPSNSCCGTLWKYSTTTGQLTTLVNFDGDTVPADGMFPGGGVVLDAAGNLYGGTISGGTFGDGLIYEYSAAGQLSTLVAFSGPNGGNPEGSLTFDTAGNIYGVTEQGGTSGYGTVFKMTPNPGGGACASVIISSVTFNPANLPDGSTGTGTVTLAAPAPAGGAIVGLQTDNSFGVVPATVTVPGGSTSANFSFFAQPGVLSNTPVTVTASIGNSTAQESVTITPVSSIVVASISLSPGSVQAGANVNGTVTLNKPAPSGGATVTLSSSNTAVATVASTVTVQSGKTSENFQVRTQNVRTASTATISGTFGNVTKSATLTVTPKN